MYNSSETKEECKNKMPHYDYKCPYCENVVTVQHGMTERPQITCLDCQVEADENPVVMKKLISRNTLVTYRGEGWTRKESANAAAGIPAEVAKTAEELGRL